MPRLYNLDGHPVVIDQDKPAVQPGEGYDFSAAQVEAGVAGRWSEQDPREGQAAERAFRRSRDARKASESTTDTPPDPAVPGDKE